MKMLSRWCCKYFWCAGDRDNMQSLTNKEIRHFLEIALVFRRARWDRQNHTDSYVSLCTRVAGIFTTSRLTAENFLAGVLPDEFLATLTNFC
jgi:hypothetical protein